MPGELLEYITNHEDAFKSKARLSSLYSDFSPLKSTNPDGYAANISAWRSALFKASSAGVVPNGSPITLRCGDKLVQALARRDLGRPLALGCVLDEAIAAKELVPLREFANATSSIYQKRWLSHIRLPSAWEAAQWALQAAGISRPSSAERPAEGDFVVMANVEAAAEAIVASVQRSSTTPTSRIYSLSTFRHAFSHVISSSQPLTDSDMHILLLHLSRDKHVASVSTQTSSSTIDDPQPTIKFSPYGSEATPPSPVTSTDHTIASLQTLQLSLETDTARLSSLIAAREQSARTAVSSNNKTSALSALRSKKLLSATLEKRMASLAQIESTLTAIDDAVGNAAMARAMESSASVLKQLNRQMGGVERVEAAMEEVAEAKADVEDVSKVLGEEANAGFVDEGEVDEEFEALLNEQKAEQKPETGNEEKGEVVALPDVPSKEPGKQKSAEEQNDDDDIEARLSDISLDESPVKKKKPEPSMQSASNAQEE